MYFQNIMLCEFFICIRRFEFLLEEYWQKSHEKGFSPVCVWICLIISLLTAIVFWQYGQAYFLESSFIGKFCKKITLQKITAEKMYSLYIFRKRFWRKRIHSFFMAHYLKREQGIPCPFSYYSLVLQYWKISFLC